MDLKNVLEHQCDIKSFIGIKETYPDIVNPSFVNEIIEENDRKQTCRTELMSLDKEFLKNNFSFLNSFDCISDYEKYVQDLENKTDIFKMIYCEKVKVRSRVDEFQEMSWIFNDHLICSSDVYDLIDACQDYYLFQSSRELFQPMSVLVYLIVYDKTKQERIYYKDVPGTSKYFLKQNGYIYSVIKSDEPLVPEALAGPVSGAGPPYLYDYETKQKIKIPFAETRFAYGSKYFACFQEENTCTVYNHSGSIISTLYGPFNYYRCPTSIENDIMTGLNLYVGDYGNRYTEFVYDINVSPRSRIRSLVLCKQAFHIPKEVYKIIYSFIRL